MSPSPPLPSLPPTLQIRHPWRNSPFNRLRLYPLITGVPLRASLSLNSNSSTYSVRLRSNVSTRVRSRDPKKKKERGKKVYTRIFEYDLHFKQILFQDFGIAWKMRQRRLVYKNYTHARAHTCARASGTDKKEKISLSLGGTSFFSSRVDFGEGKHTVSFVRPPSAGAGS